MNDIFIPNTTLATADLLALFPAATDTIHLDVGSGLGHFVAEMGVKYPQNHWVGLEHDGQVMRRAVRKVRYAGVQNVRLLTIDARPFLLESVPPQTLDHIWINFPDPWPKKKHAARRHTNPWMVGLMVDRLKLTGELHLATDVPAYFEAMQTALSQRSDIEAVQNTPWRRQTLGVETKYERKWRKQGKPIFYADWRKVAQNSNGAYPYLRCPAPQLTLEAMPTPGLYTDEDDRALKILRPYRDGRVGFVFFNPQIGIKTHGQFTLDNRFELRGAWTDWKIALMNRVLAGNLQQRGAFVISTNPNRLNLKAIHAYLTRSYWTPNIPRMAVRQAIENSFCFGLYHHQTQIGFARVVTDYTSFAYLADVYVLEDYQGQGLGKWLVQTVLDHPGLQTVRRFMLLTRDAHELYRRFGFAEPPTPLMVMEKKVKPSWKP